jgi:outer membrane protein assembly factor BamB
MPWFVYCVDIETGKRIWRFEERGQFTGAPYISKGKLFIGQRGGTPYFYCLNAATGEMIWKKRFGHVWASANGLDGKVYLNSEGGTFYCVDENTGDVIWQYQAGLGLSYNTPGFFQNLVYFGSNHDYYAFDQHTGELKWKYNIGEGKTDSGNFLIEDGVFYCGGMFGGRYSAVNALTGKEIWILDNVGSNTSPTTDGTNLIVDMGGVAFTTYAKTVALDLKTGEIKYELPFGGLSGPALGNNLVFMAARMDPYIRAWDVKTGEIRWKFRMGGRGAESCITIYGDKAFFLADDSYAYCFK